MTPYRPEDAKSIGREITFQKDVTNYELLRDVLFLLSLCVEHRMKQAGLHGKGITLKVTYADMKGITRSRSVFSCDSAVTIYREAAQLLEQIEKRPVRLIGVGIYNLSAEAERQMCLEDVFEPAAHELEDTLRERFSALQERYQLDFAGHLEQIYRGETLHKAAEYMRRHFNNVSQS